MKLQSWINGNSVKFYTDYQGARIIVLEGRLESKSDMVRLYRLARERLNEIVVAIKQAA